jgi:hypothetical protein
MTDPTTAPRRRDSDRDAPFGYPGEEFPAGRDAEPHPWQMDAGYRPESPDYGDPTTTEPGVPGASFDTVRGVWTTPAPVLGSQAADNAAWADIRAAVVRGIDAVAGDPDPDEITARVVPILARLVDGAVRAAEQHGAEPVRLLHVRRSRPRRSCCAGVVPSCPEPGTHPDVCGSPDHGLGGEPWPCATIRALDDSR